MKYKTFENGGTVQGAVTINGLNMTGPLKLERDPVEVNEAFNKRYADSIIENINAGSITSGILSTDRIPNISGDFVSVAGTGVINLVNSGVVPGTHTKVTVNHGGIVTIGASLVESDIPGFGWEKIISGKPVTLDGYGITNAASKNGGTVYGNITLSGEPVNPTDVATKGYVDAVLANRSGFSVGDIVSNDGEVVPTNFLRCNGGELVKASYPALYAVVGDEFGNNQTPGAGKPRRQQNAFNNNQNTDITGWTSGTSLPIALHSSQAVITKNRVYLLGGWNGAGDAVATVYTAPINADGTLGAWTTAAPLPDVVSGSQAIVTKNRVYLLGGWNGAGGAVISTVYTAPINADGTLGAWTTAAPLPDVAGSSQAIVTKNRVYLLGGWKGAGAISTVYTAPINADGTLGAWTTAAPLPDVAGSSQAIVTKNRVYLLGGVSGAGFISTVYTAPINADGTLGAWTTAAPLPAAVHSFQAIVTKNRVYLLGGWNGTGGAVNGVYTATINEDGTLGTWVTGTVLPANISHTQAIVTSSRIYLLGGRSGASSAIVRVALFTGGSNDYSPYYDGSYLLTDNGKFRLPDYTTTEKPIGDYIIKAL